MKKPELLVPAGNMECLYQAVQNGCDAVYLACKNFGARKFAANFTNEEIVKIGMKLASSKMSYEELLQEIKTHINN